MSKLVDVDSRTAKRLVDSLHFRELIVRTSFDEALARLSGLIGEVAPRAYGVLSDLLDAASKAGSIIDSVQGARGRGAVRLVFSETTTKNLKSGRWKLPLDGNTGLKRAEARDAAGRIREGAKVKGLGVGKRILGGVVTLAHVISAIDMQIQLEKIDAKLDRLFDFHQAERLGELRGAYVSLQKSMVEFDSAVRRRNLSDLSRKLDELQGRFLETAKATLASIRDPTEIGRLKAIFSSQGAAERELRANLAKTIGELRLSDFCHQLNTIIHIELGQAHVLVAHHRGLAAGYAGIKASLVEKVGYLSHTDASVIVEKIEHIEKAVRSFGPQIDHDGGQLILPGEEDPT